MRILKHLRRKKNVNQSDLAKAIGVSLRTIQLYEKENANIPIKNLNKIAEYFGVGIDRLYAKEVNEGGSLYDKGNPASKKAHTIQKLAPGKFLLKAPLILGRGQHEYLEGFDNMEYLKTLPQVGFVVEQVTVGSYLSFEIVNSAMDNDEANRIPVKSIVLGKLASEKQFSKQFRERDAYWILVGLNTIMCKKITHFDQKRKSITCHSLSNSPEYPDFVVSIADILAFYKIIKKQLD